VPQSLGKLIDEITVDAYDIDEQLSGFLQVFQDEVTVPSSATVLGMAIEVVGADPLAPSTGRTADSPSAPSGSYGANHAAHCF